jgi:hypothetical protein
MGDIVDALGAREAAERRHLMRKAVQILVLPAAAGVFFLIGDQLMRLIVNAWLP